jgi:hypothetical protein
VNTLWFVGGAGIVGVVVAFLTSWSRGRQSDMGAVSHQWIAEHRLGQGQDLRR